MTVQIEDISAVEKKLSFVVSTDKVNEALNSAYRLLGTQVRIDGFRKGKVPRRVLEQRYGHHIEGEVSGQVISDAFEEAVEEHNLVPVSQPIIDQGKLQRGADYSFSVTVEIKPDVAITGWEGIDVEWERVEVDDDAVDSEIENMLQRQGTVEAAEDGHEITEGDMIIVNGTVTAKGQDEPRKLEGLMVLAGQGGMGMAASDWLADKVIGLKIGDTKSEKSEIPEGSFGEGWDGKKATLEFTVSEIKVTKLPELDDDFAQDAGFDTLAELKADLRFKVEEHKRAHVRGHASHSAIETIIGANSFEVPQGLIRYEAESQLNQQMRQFAQMSGQVPAMRLENLPEDAQKNLMEQAEFAVRQSLILEAVAKSAELEVTEDDIEAKIAEMAAEIGQHPSAIKGLLQKQGSLDGLKERLITEKAMDLILEKCNVIETDPTDHSHHDH
jgi:trigger factor